MKSLSISILLNGILSFIASFILCFCIFRLISPNKMFCIAFALILSVIFSYIVILRSKEKRTRSSQRLSWTNKTAKLNIYLSTLKNSEIIALLADLLKNKYNLDTEKFNEHLSTEHFVILPIFLYEQTTAKDILQALKTVDTTNKRVIIITFYLSATAVELCAQHNFALICGEDVTKLMESNQTQTVLEEKKLKPKFSLSRFFKRKMGWKFITYGIFFDLFSLICFYPIYYVATGSIFIIYGLIALFFGEKPITNTIDLDKIFNKT